MAERVDDRDRMLAALRVSAPVHRDAASASFVLSRMDDCRALLTDPTMLRDADRAEPGALVHAFKPKDTNRPGDRNSGIGWLDGPDHARVRGPIALALNRRVAAMRGAVAAVVDEVLAGLEGRDGFDVASAFAAPIPILVVGRLLGVDTGDLARFRAWSEAAIGVFSPGRTPAQEAATKAASEAISDYLDAAMAERRRAPRDDLIGDLVQAQAAGAPLSDSEIRVNAMNLLLGGNLTTADLIASAIWLLLAHPDQRARLAADPGLIGGAIEETLRLEPPTEGTQRIASRDTAIRGCPVREGQVAAALIRAANRDPDAFEDPDRFDIGRKGRPHISFGGGPHLCIGAPLARLQAQTAVAALLARYPRLRLAEPDAPPAWAERPFFRGLSRLPVLA